MLSIWRLERQRYGRRKENALFRMLFVRSGNALKFLADETKAFSLCAEKKAAAKAGSFAWNTAVSGAGSDCIATKLYR